MLSHKPIAARIYRGSVVDFLVLSRHEIAAALPDVPYVVVSVTDPDRMEATLAESPHQKAVLRLRFHDKSGPRAALSGKVAMTPAVAREILAFVRAHLSEVALIVCQCEAGISRSAAIAAALSRILQGEDLFFFAQYAPNDWIYQTLLKASEEGNYASK